MKIKKLKGKITEIIDISKTAKEVRIKLSEPLGFVAGSFINIFIDTEGEKIRRAYSISSSPTDQENIAITVRLTPEGRVTPLFWNKNLIGETLDIMGPLGLNTADKMLAKKIYLFAFGVGAGVVKSLTSHFLDQHHTHSPIENLIIFTGSRSEEEILYKEYFDSLAKKFKGVNVYHAVSGTTKKSPPLLNGHIQDHIDSFDFSNSDVYVCGQEKACNDLTEKIKSKNPNNCNYFIEGFH